LCAILDYAIAQQASDVHITARVQGSYLKLRCQGALRESVHAACSLQQHKQLINRVRVLCGLSSENPFHAQDGSFLYACGSAQRCFRVSILPSFFGENCVIRLPEQSALLELSDLGLCDFTEQNLRKCIHRHEGLLLFTGPTGSGKTTIMYACLLEAARQGLHIVSLEDPIERVVPGVTQVPVRSGQGLDFSQALRASLRQDPDVIMLGELRDKESAAQCMQAAITGHLVLATLHARDILHVPARLAQIGVQEDLIMQSLDMIVNQRLVSHLCENCKKKVSDTGKMQEDIPSYLAPGCESCHWTGRGSRHILEEVLVVDKHAKESLTKNSPYLNKKYLRENEHGNFLSAQEKLFHWLRDGKINQETVQRLADTFSL
jgi:type IV pilus assembly protein PilB